MKRTLEDMKHPELEKLLDVEFSIWIRLTHCMGGYCSCVTCGRIHYWRGGKIDNGHYIPRGHRATRYDERNCRPQCVYCNQYNEGEHWKFRQVLVDEYGEGEIKNIEYTATIWGNTRHPKEWLIEKIKEFRVLNKPLLERAKEWS